MDTLIETIRTATANEATDEQRAAGAHACRTLLTALEAKAGQPMAAAAPTPTSQIETIAAVVRGMPVDQLLDVAITRLRAALPAGTEPSTVKPIAFHIVPIPR